ncbi:Uncharacterised protein [Providencia rettgeri]|nr:Uncharacterised protein [Providencia rettgeri]
MADGISVGVSFVANPNINPWSPAPRSSREPRSTPWAISLDCLPIALITEQVLPSIPLLALS